MAEHKHAAVLRAIADGKTVQFSRSLDEWMDFDEEIHSTPLDPQYSDEWRIKPEPKPDVVRWVNAYRDMGWETSHDALNGSLPSLAGLIKLTFDGETGKLKSAEVLP